MSVFDSLIRIKVAGLFSAIVRTSREIWPMWFSYDSELFSNRNSNSVNRRCDRQWDDIHVHYSINFGNSEMQREMDHRCRCFLSFPNSLRIGNNPYDSFDRKRRFEAFLRDRSTVESFDDKQHNVDRISHENIPHSARPCEYRWWTERRRDFSDRLSRWNSGRDTLCQ